MDVLILNNFLHLPEVSLSHTHPVFDRLVFLNSKTFLSARHKQLLQDSAKS